MGNVVRIGDSVSCGDHAGSGSGNVFAGGMPITTQQNPETTGHGCFPSTVFIGPFSSTVFVNNAPVVLKDKTKIATHCCGQSCHDGIASTGADTVSIEE